MKRHLGLWGLLRSPMVFVTLKGSNWNVSVRPTFCMPSLWLSVEDPMHDWKSKTQPVLVCHSLDRCKVLDELFYQDHQDMKAWDEKTMTLESCWLLLCHHRNSYKNQGLSRRLSFLLNICKHHVILSRLWLCVSTNSNSGIIFQFYSQIFILTSKWSL